MHYNRLRRKHQDTRCGIGECQTILRKSCNATFFSTQSPLRSRHLTIRERIFEILESAAGTAAKMLGKYSARKQNHYIIMHQQVPRVHSAPLQTTIRGLCCGQLLRNRPGRIFYQRFRKENLPKEGQLGQ